MISLDKRDIRRAVREQIKILSSRDKERLSSLIFSKISELQEIKNASTIAIFSSLPDEPQTATFIEKLQPQKRIVLPRINGEEMDFYELSAGVQRGYFGIMEPIATTPISPSEIDVMIVPGVAFTPEGARLGRGKGFYDRYLSRKEFRAHTIGVCYPCQLLDELPTEPHDRRLNRIVY